MWLAHVENGRVACPSVWSSGPRSSTAPTSHLNT